MLVLRALAIQLLALTLSTAHPKQATTSPAIQPVEPPSQPGSNYDPQMFQAPLPPADLAYLRQFSGAPAKDLLRDKQFKKLMKLFVPGCIFHYGRDMSLPDALSMAFDGSRIRSSCVTTATSSSSANRDRTSRAAAFSGSTWRPVSRSAGSTSFPPTANRPPPSISSRSKSRKRH